MEKQRRLWYIFCGVTPVFVYYGISMLSVVCAGYFGWSNHVLNLVNSTVSLIVLYTCFYRKYQPMFRDGNIPPLFFRGSLQRQEGRIAGRHYGWIILFGCGISLFANNVIVLLQLNERITTYKPVAQNLYSGGMVAVLLRTVILAACMEELMMRGLFYRCVSMALGRVGGMLVVNFVFGLLHGNLLQGLYAFVLGIGFTYVYDKYNRSLVASVMAHMAANLISVLGTMVPELVRLRNRYFYGVTLCSGAACIVAVIVMQCLAKRWVLHSVSREEQRK